ncbi:hypothetical protein BH10PAT3_BH10PAT3_0040 [soil metagenome]
MSELPQAFPAKLTGEEFRNQYHDESGRFVSRATIVDMWREQLGWEPLDHPEQLSLPFNGGEVTSATEPAVSFPAPAEATLITIGGTGSAEKDMHDHVGFTAAAGLGVMASQQLRGRSAHASEGPGEQHLAALKEMPSSEKVWTSGGTALAFQELRNMRVKYEDGDSLKKQKRNKIAGALFIAAGLLTGFLGIRSSEAQTPDTTQAPQLLEVGVMPPDLTSEMLVTVEFEGPTTTLPETLESPDTTEPVAAEPVAVDEPNSDMLAPAETTPVIPSVDPVGETSGDAIIIFDIDAWPLTNAENLGKTGAEAFTFAQEVLDAYNLENGSNFVWNHETGMFEDSGRIINRDQLRDYNTVMQKLLALEPVE